MSRRKAVLFAISFIILLITCGCAKKPANIRNRAVSSAASFGRTAKVRRLVAQGCDYRSPDPGWDGLTPLDLAARHGYRDTAKFLVSRGVKPDLATASGIGDMKAVEQFISQGYDVNARKANGDTALHWAANNGHLDIVALLIAHGADVNATGYMSKTPLHAANNPDIARFLISKGAKIDLRDDEDATSLFYAASRDPEIAKVLMDAGADINTRSDCWKQTCLQAAVAAGNLELARTLLSRGALADLFSAAALGDVSLTRKLIATGEKATEVNAESETPLHWAAQFGQVKTASILLANGADPNAKDRAGETPLHHALTKLTFAEIDSARDPKWWEQREKTELPLAKLLLQHGADPDIKDSGGLSVRYFAKNMQFIDVLTLMEQFSPEKKR